MQFDVTMVTVCTVALAVAMATACIGPHCVVTTVTVYASIHWVSTMVTVYTSALSGVTMDTAWTSALHCSLGCYHSYHQYESPLHEPLPCLVVCFVLLPWFSKTESTVVFNPSNQ